MPLGHKCIGLQMPKAFSIWHIKSEASETSKTNDLGTLSPTHSGLKGIGFKMPRAFFLWHRTAVVVVRLLLRRGTRITDA
eukprot:8237822-Pyramimonas_sp.AAC.1